MFELLRKLEPKSRIQPLLGTRWMNEEEPHVQIPGDMNPNKTPCRWPTAPTRTPTDKRAGPPHDTRGEKVGAPRRQMPGTKIGVATYQTALPDEKLIRARLEHFAWPGKDAQE
jgi:hypothetical protein